MKSKFRPTLKLKLIPLPAHASGWGPEQILSHLQEQYPHFDKEVLKLLIAPYDSLKSNACRGLKLVIARRHQRILLAHVPMHGEATEYPPCGERPFSSQHSIAFREPREAYPVARRMLADFHRRKH